MSSTGGPQPDERSLRERNRAGRVRALLDTAVDIASREGEAALTMRRLAAELDCSEGTVYRYFPSRGLLLAAVRGEEMEVP